MIPMLTMIAVPLRGLDDGAIRIGLVRVLLELVIHAFQRGATPESIVQGYSSLRLADVYAVIAYYLLNRDIVDDYVRRADEEGERNRLAALERDPSRSGLRERLLARLAAQTDADSDRAHG